MPAPKRSPSSSTRSTSASKPATKRSSSSAKGTASAAASGAKATGTSARKAGSPYRDAGQIRGHQDRAGGQVPRLGGHHGEDRQGRGQGHGNGGQGRGPEHEDDGEAGGHDDQPGQWRLRQRGVDGRAARQGPGQVSRPRHADPRPDPGDHRRRRLPRSGHAQDANELVAELVRRGRTQGDDLLGEIEALLGKGRDQLESATKRARKSDPVDRIVRGADRARRTVGVGPSFPILGYDDLNANQIQTRIKELGKPDLRKVLTYERKHANRKSVVGALEKAIG